MNGKIPEKELNHMETCDLPDTEFSELGEEQIKSLYGFEHF